MTKRKVKIIEPAEPVDHKVAWRAASRANLKQWVLIGREQDGKPYYAATCTGRKAITEAKRFLEYLGAN